MTAREAHPTRILGAVAVWVLVVATGSWLVWTVIATVGKQPGADVAVPAHLEPGDVGTSPSGATETPSSSRVGEGPTGSAEPATAPPSARPDEPTAAPRPTGPTSAARTRPATRTLTWTGSAGTVTTRCTGSRIELAGASASADGYVVEVDDRGPDRVRVEFEGRGEETVPETRVEARCVAGRPSYDVRAEG